MKRKLYYFRLSFFYIFLLLLPLSSCDEDDSASNPDKGETIRGQWEFTLVPDQYTPDPSDTIGLKGTNPFEAQPKTMVLDQVYLYSNNEDEIIGYLYNFKLIGNINGNDVLLDIYEPPDGIYDPAIPVSSMNKIANISLTIDDFGILNGSGSYLDAFDGFYKKEHTFLVHGKKIGDVSTPLTGKKGDEIQSDPTKIICNLITDFTSLAIGYLSGDAVRPMGGCGLHKDGRGYYVFGNTGPGSIVPLWTQTIYYPYSFDFCPSKKFHFTFRLKGNNIGVNSLINTVENDLNIFSSLGFGSGVELGNTIRDFHNKFGGFGVTMVIDSQNGHLGFYFNHEKGSDSDVRNHTLYKKIVGKFSYGNSVYTGTGKDISDTWHLITSAEFICNTPLVIVYLFGTNKVNYD